MKIEENSSTAATATEDRKPSTNLSSNLVIQPFTAIRLNHLFLGLVLPMFRDGDRCDFYDFFEQLSPTIHCPHKRRCPNSGPLKDQKILALISARAGCACYSTGYNLC